MPNEEILEVEDYNDLTVPQLQEELERRGVEFLKSDNKPVLVDKLEASDEAEEEEPAEEAPEEEGPEVEPVEEEEEEEAPAEEPRTESALKAVESAEGDPAKAYVDVVQEDRYIRTYSKEVHGADYKDLAQQFVDKVPGRSIVKAGEIERLRVSYRERNIAEGRWDEKTEMFSGPDFKSRAIAWANAVGSHPVVVR